MHVIRNLTVPMWWIVVLVLLSSCPAAFFCMTVALILSAPWVAKFLSPSLGKTIQCPLGLAKFNTLYSVTMLTLTKAALGEGLLPKRRGNITDRS